MQRIIPTSQFGLLVTLALYLDDLGEKKHDLEIDENPIGSTWNT